MKKKYSLRTSLVITLLIFVLGILSLIYVFQITFLDDFYRANKQEVLQRISDEVIKKLDSDDLDTNLDEISMFNEVCVRTVSNNDKYNHLSACTLKNLDNELLDIIVNQTSENNNEKLFKDFKYKSTYDDTYGDTYIFSRILENKTDKILILVSSIVTPLDTTIATIQNQYIYIALIVIVMAIVLALIISKLLIKPIKQINLEASNLYIGKYNGDNIKTNCEEFSNLNETLEKSNSEIISADKAKKELLGNISHDLRTPLTMIVGYGEMIRDIKQENTKDNINVIIDEAKRLSALVDDLIDISKLDSEIKFDKKDVYINDVLDSVYHQYEKYCKTQNVELLLKKDINALVNIDVERIKQVLYNFINNALNYCDNNNPKIIIGSEKIDNVLRIYVYDNGSGIEEKDIDKIWDRYYKVDKSHIRHHIGSGIGLSLAKELLIKSELNYGVESKIGEFCKFYFDIMMIS